MFVRGEQSFMQLPFELSYSFGFENELILAFIPLVEIWTALGLVHNSR